MENITGLNIERAKSDIQDFYGATEFAYKTCVESFVDFFYELYLSWASPVAKEFTTTMHSRAYSFLLDFYHEKEEIVEKSVAAANTLATSNGTSFSFEPGFGSGYSGENILSDVFPCEEELNGVVGMDISAVKTILNTFESRAETAMIEIDSIPEGIALYDPEGNLLSSYNSNIKRLRSELEEILNSIVSKINECTTTEMNVVLRAKEQATATMNG